MTFVPSKPSKPLERVEQHQDNTVPDILTAAEVARELRCFKAHVSKAIAGKLRPAAPIGEDYATA